MNHEGSKAQSEGAAIEAGRIMLTRIRNLIAQSQDFAFETTLATKSFLPLIKEAKSAGYSVNLIYFWLKKLDFAIDRVKSRVAEGGHNIPEDVIKRRYYRGIFNFKHRYIQEVDYWLLLENSSSQPMIIAEGKKTFDIIVANFPSWDLFNNLADNEPTEH